MEINEDNKSVTKTIDSIAQFVVKYMAERSLRLAAAESCTGGAFSKAVTAVPGSSAVFSGAVVAYTEEVKMKLLGVDPRTLEKYTVYSCETALEMSRGACRAVGADVGVGITGIAGPGGGTEDKPVGTVFVAVTCGQTEIVRHFSFGSECMGSSQSDMSKEFYEKLDRRNIRELTVLRSLQMVQELLPEIT